MKTPALALMWELGWKNRVVFPMLAVLFVLGAALAHALAHASRDVWWVGYATGSMMSAFLASLLLGLAPFTLMESQHGWRMNSMTTRWFVLPVRTSVLVVGPFVAGCVFIALLMSAWTPVIHQVIPEFDGRYFLLVLVFGVAGIQALAWILARRASWFWPLAGVFFLFVLLLGTIPQDSPHWKTEGSGMYWVVGGLAPALGLVAWAAARWNRRGAWSGGLGIGRIGVLLGRSGSDFRNLRSPAAALLRADTLGVVRGFCFTWLALAALILGSQCLQLLYVRPGLSFRYGWLALIALQTLPFLGIVWLALAGLVLGCEPRSGFRTRLSAFRATTPVSAGTLAGQRILTALLLLLIVWGPLLVLCQWYDPELAGNPSPQAARQMLGALTKFVAISAFVLIGALPLALWGRLEGFPNLLLVGMLTWIGPWLLSTCLASEQDGIVQIRWPIALGWLTVKLGLAGWALACCWRAGHITWRFAAGLIVGWLVLCSLLVSAVPVRNSEIAVYALGIVLLMPLGRLALCPLAVAGNRHR